MGKYATRDSVQYSHVEENWKKLPNFQLIPPLSVEQEIERFTTAGKDLQKLKGLGVFDFNEAQPIDDELEDVTREDDFDLIDAAVAQRDAMLRMQAQAANAAGTVAQSKGNNEPKVVEKDSKVETDSRVTESPPVTEKA